MGRDRPRFTMGGEFVDIVMRGDLALHDALRRGLRGDAFSAARLALD